MTQAAILHTRNFMSILKVSVFQKSLLEGLNLNTIKKLAALKSDFLIMPEFFFADDKIKNYAALEDKSQFALDWLLKLSEAYKGVIIGGTVILNEEGEKFVATPVIRESAVVDWYRKRSLNDEENQFAKPGTEPGVFILGGHRFSILSGKDIENPDFFRELDEQGIRLVFSLTRSKKKWESLEEKHERDETYFCKPAREHNLVITKCAPSGFFLGEELQGRSMVVTPSGISWRVSPDEEHEEVLKTVMINAHFQ